MTALAFSGANPPSRVVVRLPNPAGDVVLATPALRAIRRALPRAHVTWAGRPPALALLDGLLDRDDVQSIDGPLDHGVFAPKRLGASWRSAAADAVVVMPGSLSSALAAQASHAPVRLGYAGRGRRALLTCALPIPLEHGRRRSRPMREHYLDLARALGGEDDGGPPRLATTPEGERAADARLASLGLSTKRFVAASPGASFGSSKVYPPRSLGAVLARIRAATGLVPLVLGGPGEVDLVMATADAAGRPCARIAPDVARWPETKSILARAALVIGPDAGPRHVAAALGTPAVAIVGPTDPRWGSGDEERVTVVRKEGLSCLACHQEACPVEGHPCMESLDPEDVARAALARLEAVPR